MELESARGQSTLALGNLLGSNIFNILCVLGGTAAVAGQGVVVPPSALRFDIPVMVAVSVACLDILITGSVVSRREGALLVVFYVTCTLYLALDASGHHALRPYSTAMASFVLPLTALGLAGSLVRWLRRSRGTS